MPLTGSVGDVFGQSGEFWAWVGLAASGWLIAVVGIVLAVRARRRAQRPPAWPREERPPAPREPAAEPARPEPPPPSGKPPVGRLLEDLVPQDDAVGGVLRWLLLETEAEAVAYLELGPGGRELLRVEPRGLDEATLARLVRSARDALVLPESEEPSISDAAVVRWLGAGGSKGIIAIGVAREEASESLRFARFLIEWARAARGVQQPFGLEEAIREIPGVAWAEEEEGGQAMRVLLAEGADAATTMAAVENLLREPGVRVRWLEPVGEPAPPAGEEARRIVEIPETPAAEAGPALPRIRLVDVTLSEDGRATAVVRAVWRGQELRGRGHGRPTTAGRYYAAAQAMADALRPLLDTDVGVEGLYSASVREGVDVLIAEVVLEGERLVGAVVERADLRDWSGARAVLDAVNRRLVQVAGRSGRI